MSKLKIINIKLFAVIFWMGCTGSITLPEESAFKYSSTYFGYNPYTNKLYLYAEIQNMTLSHGIDSVWAELYNSENIKIDENQLLPSHFDNDHLLIENIYSIKNTIADLQSDLYTVTFKMKDENGELYSSFTKQKYLTKTTDPISPVIINYSMPDTFILHPTDWSLLSIDLHVFDENGIEDIKTVEYKVMSFFEPCTADNNGDGVITSPEPDSDYTNYDADDWLFSPTDEFGSNNSFIWNVEIPMRPFNGLAPRDDEGNIILNYEDKDCGGTGDVFFQFIITDDSSLVDLIENIHLEILAPTP